MGKTQFSFKRYEKKYLITTLQYAALLDALGDYMKNDAFARSTVCSVYYDTPDFSLIRASLEKPVYKEKLRVRSYGTPTREGGVFVEIKKKYKGVVYKRRESMTQNEAQAYLERGTAPEKDSQIFREIDWFCRSHQLAPKVLISCDRFSLAGKMDENLRITFDTSVRWRDDDLDLTHGDYGRALLPSGMVLMEIKTPGAAPLWLSRLLSGLEIYPTAFSKYGSCYRLMQSEEREKHRNGVNNCA